MNINEINTRLQTLSENFYRAFTTALEFRTDAFMIARGGRWPVKLSAPESLSYYLDNNPQTGNHYFSPGGSANSLSAGFGNLLHAANGDIRRSTLYEQALWAYNNPGNWLGGQSPDHPVYMPAATEIFGALRAGQEFSFEYQSNDNMPPGINNSPREISPGFWGLPESPIACEMNEMALSHPVKLAMNFQNVAMPLLPGAWFSPDYLLEMYRNPGYFEGGQAQWDIFFGAGGSLHSLLTTACFASGIYIMVTSLASYSSGQLAFLENNSVAGVWPFYIPPGTEDYTSSYRLNYNKTISVIINCKPAVVQLAGLQAAPVMEIC